MITNINLSPNLIQLTTDHNSIVPEVIDIASPLTNLPSLNNLFSSEVTVNYKIEKENDVITLAKEKEAFTYEQVKKLSAFLYKNFHLKSILQEKLLIAGWKLKLFHESFFCLYNQSPTFTLNIEEYSIILYPIAQVACKTESKKSLILQTELENRNIPFKRVDQGLTLNIGNNFNNYIHNLLEALVASEFLDSQNLNIAIDFLEKKFLRQIASKEADFLKKMAQDAPAPLDNYLELAYKVENLFNKIAHNQINIKNDDISFIKDAIEKKGEFLLAPHIISRGFSKLKKSFGDNLYNVINQFKII